MKLLLDECMTRLIKHDFIGHDVYTVEDAGFKGLENGDLLKAAAVIYEVLVTVDRHIPDQQNIGKLNIAVLILAANRNSYTRLKPLLPLALEALKTIKPGDVVRIDG